MRWVLPTLLFVMGCSVDDRWVVRRFSADASVDDLDAGADDAGVEDAGPVTLETALAGSYPFDEDDGGRRATDVTRSARHGTLDPSCFLEPDAGRFGGALRVNAGGARLPAGALSSGVVPAFSFSLWFRADGPVTTSTVTEGGRLITFLRGGGDRVAAAVLLPGDGTDSVWFLYDEVSTSLVGKTVFPDAGLTPDRWHHVAFSYDGPRGVLRLSYDGAQQALARGVTSITGSQVQLGFSSVAPRSPAQFRGWIDEVRLWRRALSEEELRQLAAP